MPVWTNTRNPKVIDVSHWQGSIDFSKVAAAGIRGVICKATEGTNYTDKTFAGNVSKAKNAGLLVGAYHFLKPGSAVAQADYFLKRVGNDPTMLLAVDHETSGTTLADLKAFISRVKEKRGKAPVLYSGFLIKEQLKASDTFFNDVRLWLAQYSTKPTWPKQWTQPWLWQFTDKGTWPGISGGVDTNSYLGSDAALAREWWPTDQPVTPPVVVPPSPVQPDDPGPVSSPAPTGFWARLWWAFKALFGRR